MLDIWYFILFHRISYLKFIETYLKYSPKFVTSFVYQKVIITTPIIDFRSHRFHIGFFLFHCMMIIAMVIMVILIHWSMILLVTASIHSRISNKKSKRRIIRLIYIINLTMSSNFYFKEHETILQYHNLYVWTAVPIADVSSYLSDSGSISISSKGSFVFTWETKTSSRK